MRQRIIDRTGPVPIRNKYGSFNLHGYLIAAGPRIDIHLALVHGDLSGVTPTRINSACLTSEIFHDDRCDCAWQLEEALRRFACLGSGLLLYHPTQEGRGIGLMRKLESYLLMDSGLTTSEAFDALGEPADCRNYGAAVAILEDLGVSKVNLLSNNPQKVKALLDAGIEVTSVDTIIGDHNPSWHAYLQSKADAFGHTISLGPPSPPRSS
jgi:3,4-dihydroxy 2-butanone 4-phosphate synthase / GTP cyclohydrolase II